MFLHGVKRGTGGESKAPPAPVRRDMTPTERGAAYPLGAYGSSLRGG